jgi:hypothetical protein
MAVAGAGAVAPGAGQAIKGAAQAGAKAGAGSAKAGASEAAEGSAAAGGKQAGSSWGNKAFAEGSDVTQSDVAKKVAKKTAESAVTQTAGAAYGSRMGGHSATVAWRTDGESLAQPDQAPGA